MARIKIQIIQSAMPVACCPKNIGRSETIAQIEVMAGFGLSQDKIAPVIGISKRTFFRWKEDERVLLGYGTGQANPARLAG